MSGNPSHSKHHRHCVLCGRRKILGIGWHRAPSFAFCKRCWPYLDPTVEWFEARNESLRNCIGQALDQKPHLCTLLGQGQAHVKIKDGEWLTDQVIRHLSLPRGDIAFEFAPLKSSVAGTVEYVDGKYRVRISETSVIPAILLVVEGVVKRVSFGRLSHSPTIWKTAPRAAVKTRPRKKLLPEVLANKLFI